MSSGSENIDSTIEEHTLLEKGEKTRRAVLGDEHVNQSMASAHPYTMDLQEMVTKYVWGDIWNRPGLSLKTRSLLNIAMLAATGQHHELAVHTKGAVNNGCTNEELKEVILQATIYCGAPSGLAAMRVVKQTLQDMGKLA